MGAWFGEKQAVRWWSARIRVWAVLVGGMPRVWRVVERAARCVVWVWCGCWEYVGGVGWRGRAGS